MTDRAKGKPLPSGGGEFTAMVGGDMFTKFIHRKLSPSGGVKSHLVNALTSRNSSARSLPLARALSQA